MVSSVLIFNKIAAVLTLLGQAAIILLFISLAVWRGKKNPPLLNFLGKRALLFSFFITLLAVGGSLFYSEFAGLDPCKLCWYQRIMMYPQVIIFALGLWKKDKHIYDYGIALSSIGALIAADHYYLQIAGSSLIPCSTIGYIARCGQRFIWEFGYISIPMMGLTAFLLIILLLILGKIYNKV